MTFSEKAFSTFIDFVSFVRHPLPPRKRAAALLSYCKLNALGLFLKRSQRKTRFCSFTLPRFSVGFVVPSYNETFFRGQYWFRSKTRKPVIIECGANIGVTTLYFKWLYPAAEIHAFEPDPAIFACYEETVQRNALSNVTAYRSAVSDTNADLQFYRGETTYGTGSLVKGRNAADSALKVKATRLSEFIKRLRRRIDFLKVDIEGGEWALFKDLDRQGSLRSVDQLVIEYHHHMGLPSTSLADVLSALTRNGFDFQCTAMLFPLASKDKPQDIMIYAYKK